MAIAREQLYQQVWAEPMTAVAKQYKVSSSFLARICTRMNVPRPPRGYWAKRKVGQPLSQPSLPDAGLGHELEWAPGGGVFRAGPRPLPKPPAKRRRKTELHATTSPTEHRLVFAVRPHFEKVYPQSSWSVEFPRPYKRLRPDVIVSTEALERALALANVLYLGLEREGYTVTFAAGDVYYDGPRLDHREESRGPLPEWSRQSWQPARPTIVSVGTVAFGVTVYELTEYVEVERVDDRYVRRDFLPPKRRRASASPVVQGYIHVQNPQHREQTQMARSWLAHENAIGMGRPRRHASLRTFLGTGVPVFGCADINRAVSFWSYTKYPWGCPFLHHGWKKSRASFRPSRATGQHHQTSCLLAFPGS